MVDFVTFILFLVVFLVFDCLCFGVRYWLVCLNWFVWVVVGWVVACLLLNVGLSFVVWCMVLCLIVLFNFVIDVVYIVFCVCLIAYLMLFICYYFDLFSMIVVLRLFFWGVSLLFVYCCFCVCRCFLKLWFWFGLWFILIWIHCYVCIWLLCFLLSFVVAGIWCMFVMRFCLVVGLMLSLNVVAVDDNGVWYVVCFWVVGCCFYWWLGWLCLFVS